MIKLLSFIDLFKEYIYIWVAIFAVLFVVIIIIVITLRNKNKKNDSNDKTNNQKQDNETTPVESKKKTEDSKINIKPNQIIDENKLKEKIPEIPKKPETPKPEKPKLEGKWIIMKKAENEYTVNLLLSNEDVLLKSESFANVASARLGMKTIQKYIEMNRFQTHRDKNNHYFYKIKDTSNRTLAMGEVFTNKKACSSSISNVKKYSLKSELSMEIIENLTYIYYQSNKELVKDESFKGKWEIIKDDIEYGGKLISSKGTVLLVTERFASTNSVYNAINAFKRSIESGEFIIDYNEKNQKYYYRLRNNNSTTLYVGDLFNDKDKCIEEIELIRNTCNNSEIVETI